MMFAKRIDVALNEPGADRAAILGCLDAMRRLGSRCLEIDLAAPIIVSVDEFYALNSIPGVLEAYEGGHTGIEHFNDKDECTHIECRLSYLGRLAVLAVAF